MPFRVLRTISSPGLRERDVDEVVALVERDADDAAGRGRLYAIRSVFFTIPWRVAISRCAPSANSRTGMMLVIFSFSA